MSRGAGQVAGEQPRYFQPVGVRVNRGGSVGFFSGSGSGCPDAAAIYRASAAAAGSPPRGSTNISACGGGMSNFLPQTLQVTCSSTRRR